MEFYHQKAKTQYVSNGDIKYAYRRLGKEGGIPLVFLTHFRGTMDYLDPLLINSLAASRPVILFDNAGVGQSTGEVATTVKAMAQHVIDFVSLIGVKEIDLLGFSIGGFAAQLVALNGPPGLVRRLILAATTTSYGEGIVDHSPERQQEVGRLAGQPNPSYDDCFDWLFFLNPSEASQAAGRAWWKRVYERDQSTSGEERSQLVSTGYADGGKGLQAMLEAMNNYFDPSKTADAPYNRLKDLKIPVFIAQGHDDFMIPTANSVLMEKLIPDTRLKIFPDSGHGFLYQFAEEFADDVNKFLELK